MYAIILFLLVIISKPFLDVKKKRIPTHLFVGIPETLYVLYSHAKIGIYLQTTKFSAKNFNF